MSTKPVGSTLCLGLGLWTSAGELLRSVLFLPVRPQRNRLMRCTQHTLRSKGRWLHKDLMTEHLNLRIQNAAPDRRTMPPVSCEARFPVFSTRQTEWLRSEMNPLSRLIKTRPKHCGSKNFYYRNQRYLEWKIFHNQLWRFPEHQVKAEDVPPSTPWQPDRTKTGKPRKGDLVYESGEFIGVIAYINHEEACFTNGESRPRDDFLYYRSGRGGRHHWHLD